MSLPIGVLEVRVSLRAAHVAAEATWFECERVLFFGVYRVEKGRCVSSEHQLTTVALDLDDGAGVAVGKDCERGSIPNLRGLVVAVLFRKFFWKFLVKVHFLSPSLSLM